MLPEVVKNFHIKDILPTLKQEISNLILTVRSLNWPNWYDFPGFIRLIFGSISVCFLVYLNIFLTFWNPIYKIIFSRRRPIIIRSNLSRYDVLKENGSYKYEPQFLPIPWQEGGSTPRMHYIDEGPVNADITILCLHGDLTWSYLYRKVLATWTQAGYRVIAPDLIGYGKSDKFGDPEDYSFACHISSIRFLINHLKLKNVILIGHEIGGQIGLNIASRRPDLFAGIVVMNTGLPVGKILDDNSQELNSPLPPIYQRIQSIIPILMWTLFMRTLGRYISVGVLLRYTQSSSKDCIQGYSLPYPGVTYQSGVVKTATLYPFYRSDKVVHDNERTRNLLKTWNKPALVIMTDKDRVLLDQGRLMKNILKEARFFALGKANGMPPETRDKAFAKIIIDFIKKDIVVN